MKKDNKKDALRKSEERYRQVVEKSPNGIGIYQNGLIYYVNPAGLAMFGATIQEDLLGKSVFSIIHPDLHVDVIKRMELVASGNAVPPIEVELIRLDGSIFNAEIISQSTTYNDQPAGQVIIRDITERKLAEEEILKFKLGIDSSLDAIFITDLQGIITYANSSFEKVYGYSQDESIGRTPRILKSGHQSSEAYKYFWETLLNKGTVSGEIVNKTKDGRLITVDASNNPILDTNGNIVGFLSVNRDVTQHKIAEDALRQSEERFRTIFDSVNDAIFVHNIETGAIIDVNNRMCEMYGYSYEEALKIGIGDLNSDEVLYTQDEALGWMKKALAGESQVFEWRAKTKTGKLFWCEVNMRRANIGGTDRLLVSVRDITERKQNEAALLKAEEMLEVFFDQSLDGFFFMMLDEPIVWNDQADKEQLLEYVFSHNRITRINDAMLAQYGASHDQLLGFTPNDLFAHDIAHGKNDFRKLFDKGKSHSETDERKLNGEKIIIDGKYSCLYDHEGRITGNFGIQRDITKSKRMMEVVKKSESKYKYLFENIPAPMWIYDLDTLSFLEVNAAAVKHYGYSKQEFLRMTLKNIRPREDIDRLMQDVESTNKTLNNAGTWQHYKKNGELIYVEITSHLVDFEGKQARLVISSDITEQKNAGETIQKLSKGIEQSPSIVVITDKVGNIEYVNPTFCEVTGYTKEEAIGKNPRILKSGDMPPEIYKNLWKTISSGEVWRGELHNRNKNGELHWEWATIAAIRNENEVITNYIATKEDITERKKMQADLIITKERAEESDRLKSAFLANMSHEIRTPLNAIIGFSELLSDPDFDVEQKDEFIEHIINNGNNLLAIISDIMDISKMETGEITIRNKEIQVSQYMAGLIKQNTAKCKEKNLEFSLDIPESDPEVFIVSDSERLTQIFNNLISNAIKFTADGTIQIGYQVVDKMIRFHVKDTGIGIPAEFHKQIFERFRQIESAFTRKYGGNGLGLTISKRLGEMLGGEIWLESKLGKGSTFYFTIPNI